MRGRVLNSHIVSWPLERAVGTVAVNGGRGGGVRSLSRGYCIIFIDGPPRTV